MLGTKENVYLGKDFNSHKVSVVDQHGPHFIFLEHLHGCRDVMET